MSDAWLEVRINGHKDDAEKLEAWLFEAGALSVTLADSVDDESLEHAVLEPVPGEVRLWEATTLVGLFAQGSHEVQLHMALQNAAEVCGLSAPEYRIGVLQDQVWERTWMDTFKPMRFGHKLWICPTHAEVPDPDAVTLRLDPGMAFGTGTHATTAQCLQWLGLQTEHSVKPLEGKTVIDYGCGSGVLAIATLLLGASHCWAVDIDEQALQATRENARINHVDAHLHVAQPESLDQINADIVLANILFQPLIQLADTMAEKVRPGGSLVMSGILEEQMQPLRQRYARDFQFLEERSTDGWALMSAIRR